MGIIVKNWDPLCWSWLYGLGDIGAAKIVISIWRCQICAGRCWEHVGIISHFLDQFFVGFALRCDWWDSNFHISIVVGCSREVELHFFAYNFLITVLYLLFWNWYVELLIQQKKVCWAFMGSGKVMLDNKNQQSGQPMNDSTCVPHLCWRRLL